MSETPVIVAVVAGHGRFADGLISAVEQITGRGAAFVAVSNTGLVPAELEKRVELALDQTGTRLVFTDLPAGSCTMATRRLQRVRSDVVLVTGANVCVLMEFLFSAEAALAASADGVVDVAALATAAAEKARQTLVVTGG